MGSDFKTSHLLKNHRTVEHFLTSFLDSIFYGLMGSETVKGFHHFLVDDTTDLRSFRQGTQLFPWEWMIKKKHYITLCRVLSLAVRV